MMFFFGTLVLNFMLFFNKIETASDNYLTNLQPIKTRTYKDKNRVDALDTSRLTTLTAPRHSPTPIEHEALDLHRYSPHILESSQKTRSKEVLDISNKFKMRREHHSQGSSSTTMIQSDQIERQEQEMTPPVPSKQRRWRQKREPKRQDEKKIADKWTEARNIHKQTFREQSALIQRRLHQNDQQPGDRIEYKEEDGFKHYQSHYPDGLPYPLPHPQFVHRYHSEGSGSGPQH